MTDDQGSQDAADQTADDQQKDGTDGGEQSDDSAQDQNKDADVKIDKAEYDRLFARMQAADRAKAAAEKALAEKNKADMSETERTKTELEEARKQAAEAADRLKTTLVENAFHRENKLVWHDVSDAIAALDLSGVEIGEDGKVTGMAEAIKDVAKRKPHYVKKDEGDHKPAATGSPINGQRKGEKAESADRKALAARFPALGK